jgi:hypothetical protein
MPLIRSSTGTCVSTRMNILEPPVLPGFFRDGQRTAQGYGLFLEGREGQVGGHQLGQRGRFEALIGLFCGQHLVGAHFEQQPGFGGEGRGNRELLGECRLAAKLRSTKGSNWRNRDMDFSFKYVGGTKLYPRLRGALRRSGAENFDGRVADAPFVGDGVDLFADASHWRRAAGHRAGRRSGRPGRAVPGKCPARPTPEGGQQRAVLEFADDLRPDAGAFQPAVDAAAQGIVAGR